MPSAMDSCLALVGHSDSRTIQEKSRLFNGRYSRFLARRNEGFNGKRDLFAGSYKDMFRIKQEMEYLICNPLPGTDANAAPPFDMTDFIDPLMASFEAFIRMSEELCGLPEFYLRGTGFASTYHETVVNIVGEALVERVLIVYSQLPDCCQKARKDAVLANLLSHDEFGPVVRNMMKLWFIATWCELPPEWQHSYPVFNANTTFIPDPYAYT